ncbi:MAG: hypothetical protein V4565_05085 [Bacteroidota bacterium]
MNLKETWDELTNDFKGRIRNPLILSFILVWIFTHWAFLYRFLNSGDCETLSIKIYNLQKYLNKNGFEGMILTPLFKSFVALFSFYIIGTIAEFIKILVGKRFQIFIIRLVDKGRFVLKTELKSLENKLKQSEIENKNLEIRVGELTEFKNTADKKISEAESKLDISIRDKLKIQKNIDYNLKFREEIEAALVHLLYLKMENKPRNFGHRSEFITNKLDFLEGDWNVQTSTVYQTELNSYERLIISSDVVYNSNGNKLSDVVNKKYDLINKFVSFSFKHQISPYNYLMIKINNNNLIGFDEDGFVRFVRADEKNTYSASSN